MLYFFKIIKKRFMNKEELFRKYSINESNKELDDRAFNYGCIEIYRIMHNGELPKQDDESVMFCVDFIDKLKNYSFYREIVIRSDFGILYLTAKKMIYHFADQIIDEINKLTTYATK